MMQQKNMHQVLIQLLITCLTEWFAFSYLTVLGGGLIVSVSAEAGNGIIVIREHIELSVGVVEHLLVAGTVAAESRTVASELAAGHH